VAAVRRAGAPFAAAFGGAFPAALLAGLFETAVVGAAVFVAVDGAGEEDCPCARPASHTVASHTIAAIIVRKRKMQARGD
jgi:hypothetical protein